MSNPGLPPPPPPPPGGPEQPPPPPAGAGWAVEVDDLYLDYAGFWQRAAAAVVDWLIVAVPVGIGAVALIVALPREEPQLCELPDGSVGICEPFTAASIVVLLLAGIGWFCFMLFFWYGHLVGTKGVTPGRAALGIQVVDESGTRPIGFRSGGGPLPHLLGDGVRHLPSPVVGAVGGVGRPQAGAARQGGVERRGAATLMPVAVERSRPVTTHR